MQFFDRLILNEAISNPDKPPIIKNNNQTPDQKNPQTPAPPDFTKNQQPELPENDQEMPEPPQGANTPKNVPNDQGQEEVPPEGGGEGEEQLDAPEAGGEEGENPEGDGGEEMDQVDGTKPPVEENQDDIFSDLKPEQMDIKTIELKNQFKNINSVVTASIDKINKISRNTYDGTLVEFIIRKLLQLRDYSRDYVIKTFKTKSYLENQVEFQRMMITFNLISNLFNNIKVSRLERREMIEKKNNHLFKIKKNNSKSYPVFSRGF